MVVGMLWSYENVKNKTLTEHIKEASVYYRKKYGFKADTCHVNPDLMPDKNAVAEIAETGLRLVADKGTMKGYLWIGEEERTAF
jgi:hypothetical protein